MAQRKETANRSIESYEHRDKKRPNNPLAGLATPEAAPDAGAKKTTHAYASHLAPQLVWAGKAKHTSVEVPTVSLHVHERIAPTTIIEAVRKKNGRLKYGSHFQPFANKRDVTDGKDEDLTQEPKQIRAFRDTWELGIHSHLTYLRDRLLLARELLTESGSIFVPISDENVHRVRCRGEPGAQVATGPWPTSPG